MRRLPSPVGMPPAGVLLCARAGAPAAGLARALRARGLDVRRGTLPAARLSSAAAAAASARLLASRRRRPGRREIVVIRPMRPRRPSSRPPARSAWPAQLDASLRAVFFVARAAALAGGRGCDRLIFIVDPADERDAVACVVREGLLCLADGLAKTATPALAIGRVLIEAPRRNRAGVTDAALADAILQIVGSAAGGLAHTVRLSAAASEQG